MCSLSFSEAASSSFFLFLYFFILPPSYWRLVVGLPVPHLAALAVRYLKPPLSHVLPLHRNPCGPPPSLFIPLVAWCAGTARHTPTCCVGLTPPPPARRSLLPTTNAPNASCAFSGFAGDLKCHFFFVNRSVAAAFVTHVIAASPPRALL